MDVFIGVKEVLAKPATIGAHYNQGGMEPPMDIDPDKEGMQVTYKNGYTSWCPKKEFIDQNFKLASPDKISQVDVDGFISGYTTKSIGDKTTVVMATLKNGFVITESSSCVDSANYDESIGFDICLEKIKEKVWFLLGFLLQSAKYGFAPMVEQ